MKRMVPKMRMSKNQLNVKVGDEVIVTKYRSGFGSTERIDTVTKVTPTGRIRILSSSSQFDKFGKEIGTAKWDFSAELRIPTDEDRKRIKESNTINMANRLMEKAVKSGISYSDAVSIIGVLGGKA